MKSEMVKPIPDSAAPPAIRRSVSPGASSPHAGRDDRGRRGDADELADHQARDDTPGQRRPHRRREGVRVEPHPGVGEREQRQHQERDVRPERGLQPLVDRNRLAQPRVAARAYSRVRRLPERADQLDGLLHRLRSGVKTGISSATATPASVGCTPPMNNATHSANAQHRVGGAATRAAAAPARSRRSTAPRPPAATIGCRRSRTARSPVSAPTSSTTASVSRKMRRPAQGISAR